MSEEPTYAEVRDLLGQMVPIMVAHSTSKAPESFDLCWRYNLYETAKMLDYYNKNVYTLIETSDGEFTWSMV